MSVGAQPLLSREEMSSLLQGEGKVTAPGLTPLTLGAPPPLSREEEQACLTRFRGAARTLGNRIGMMLRREVGAEIAAPRRRRFGDLAVGPPGVTARALGPIPAPGSAGLALSIPLGDALTAVDLLLGGSGSGRPGASVQPTALESALILEIGDVIAHALASADPSGASRWKVETLVVEAESAPPVSPYETAVVVDLRLAMGDTALTVEAWIPEAWLQAAAGARREKREEVRGDGLLDLQATATARLNAGRLSLGDALALQPGDVILLEPAAEARLHLNGEPAFTGTLLRDADPCVFEISDLCKGDDHD